MNPKPSASRRRASLRHGLVLLLSAQSFAGLAGATTWQLSGELHAPGAGDGFGFAMDRDGDTLIVANIVQDDVAAFVFVRDGDGWALQDTLPVPDAGVFLMAGVNVAVDGDIAVVGTPNVTVGGVPQRGRAILYQRSGSEWFVFQLLTHPEPTQDSRFGNAVALDGDLLLVGAPGRSGIYNAAGSAHVYRRVGFDFELEQSFESPLACSACRFGQSVAVSGQRLMIGAPPAARAYSFTYEGDSWELEASLAPSDGTVSGAGFGASIALDGTRAFIGAPQALVNGEAGGAVYALQIQNDLWGHLQRLQSEPGSFGYSMALSGNKLIVGAPAAFNSVGSAIVFEHGGLSWSESQSFVEAPGQALIDGIGRSVAVDERGLVAADSRRRADGSLPGDEGMAYLYKAQVPRLLVSPQSLGFGDVPVGQSSSIKAATLANVGQKTLQVTALDAPAAPFLRHGGSCGDALPIVLAPGASCSLTYRFQPTENGAAQSNLGLASNDPLGGQTLTLSGAGVVPTLGIAPSPVNLGTVVPPDTSAPVPVTLSNQGGADLQIDAISAASVPFTRVGGTCSTNFPFVLGAGQSCTLIHEFTPTAYGDVVAEIVVTSNAASSPDAFSLHGFAEGPQLSVDSVNFGGIPVGDTQTASVTLFGSGLVTNSVTGISVPDLPFARVGGSCPEPPFEVPPDTSCTLEYEFAPVSGVDYQGFVSIEADSVGCPCLAELSGRGLQPALLLAPAALDFGVLAPGGVAVLQATLRNIGNDDLAVGSIADASGAFTRIGGDCPGGAFALTAGAECSLAYQFSPPQEADFEQILPIVSGAPDAPHSLVLIGRGDSGIFRDGFE